MAPWRARAVASRARGVQLQTRVIAGPPAFHPAARLPSARAWASACATAASSAASSANGNAKRCLRYVGSESSSPGKNAAEGLRAEGGGRRAEGEIVPALGLWPARG